MQRKGGQREIYPFGKVSYKESILGNHYFSADHLMIVVWGTKNFFFPPWYIQSKEQFIN